MRRPLQTRRPSLRPVLALLGVSGAALALPLAPRAQAIGGGAASVSQSTSPREVSGAAPTVSLFQTSASSYASSSAGGSGNTSTSEVTAAGSASGGGQGESETPRRRRSAAPEEGSRSAGRQRAERRRDREAGGSVTRSERRREPAASDGGKAVADTSKESGKATIVPPAKGPIFTLSVGYQTRYIYHGLDIISFNSAYRNDGRRDAAGNLVGRRAESSGIYFTDASVEYKGFRGGVGYVQAVDPTVPYFQNAGDIGNPDSFPGDNVQLYREVNIHLDYTVTLVPRWLDATVGFNTFFFPNTDFKGTAYQGEIPIRLTFTRIPYVRPSFSYFRYISDYKKFGAGNLNGNYIEFRLDGSVPIIDKPNFGLTIAPYAAFGYNINYLKFSGNDDVGGWNTFETGVKVPVRLGKHFTVTPFGNYGKNLNGADLVANSFAESNVNGTSGSRSFGEQTRFWGGVNLSYAF